MQNNALKYLRWKTFPKVHRIVKMQSLNSTEVAVMIYKKQPIPMKEAYIMPIGTCPVTIL